MAEKVGLVSFQIDTKDASLLSTLSRIEFCFFSEVRLKKHVLDCMYGIVTQQLEAFWNICLIVLCKGCTLEKGFQSFVFLRKRNDCDYLVSCSVITTLYLFFRGLEFMLEFLSEMVQVYRSSIDKEKTNSLTGSINNAYNNTLKRHHGFISKQLFKVSLQFWLPILIFLHP